MIKATNKMSQTQWALLLAIKVYAPHRTFSPTLVTEAILYCIIYCICIVHYCILYTFLSTSQKKNKNQKFFTLRNLQDQPFRFFWVVHTDLSF